MFLGGIKILHIMIYVFALLWRLRRTRFQLKWSAVYTLPRELRMSVSNTQQGILYILRGRVASRVPLSVTYS